MDARDAVDAFRRSDLYTGLDVSTAELEPLMQGASQLAKLFPGADDGKEQVFQVVDMDIRHLICARAVCADDSGLNPDPDLAVDVRIQTRVIRRSNRLAGLPPVSYADDVLLTPADTALRRGKRKLDDAPGATNAKRQRPSPSSKPPVYEYEARLLGGPDMSSTIVKRRDEVTPALATSSTSAASSAPTASASSGPGEEGQLTTQQRATVSSPGFLGSAPGSEVDGRPRRRVGKTRSRGNRRRRARASSPTPSEGDAPITLASAARPASPTPAGAQGRSTLHHGAFPASGEHAASPASAPALGQGPARSVHGADFAAAGARTGPAESPQFDFHFVDFQAADYVFRKPRTPPTPLPVPDITAPKPTHRSHSASYHTERSQRHRAGLPIEQLRPKTVLQEDGRPALAAETLNRTLPGWRGRIPRALIQNVSRIWGKPGLKDVLGDLHIVPYTGTNTAVTDMNGRTMLLRTTPIKPQNGGDVVEDFATDAYKFVRMCPIKAGDRSHNARGQHYACVAGHHRQYAKLPYETRFQRDYEKAIRWLFREDGPASRVTSYLSGIIDNRFPAMAERMKQNREWHEAHNGISPMFGPYWNFCVNAPTPEAGVPRVFCKPHVDALNCAVLLCAVFVFWSKEWVGEEEWSWLVIWELGIAIECPRGCFLLYPSALFFHFNARIVKCPKGQQPTPTNSTELPRPTADFVGGRGSAVWFTQSTMYSQTAQRDPKTGHMVGYEETARACFPTMEEGKDAEADDTDSEAYYLADL